MRKTVLFAVFVGLIVSGCAQGSVGFQKAGVSQATKMRDDEKCWAEARRVKGKMTDGEKAGNVVVGALLFGVVGVIGAASVNASADEPRGSYYQEQRNRCMRAKGYELG